MNQQVTSTTPAMAASSSSPPPPSAMEERYVKVASRFFRVKAASGGVGSAMVRPHYLESCFLCKGNISGNRDIFMYKGEAPFCSEDCRQEQMDMDEKLDAVARWHKQPSVTAAELAGTVAARPQMMHRRPTIANLVARTPLAAS